MHSISLHSFLTSTSSHSPFQPYSFSLSPSLISPLFSFYQTGRFISLSSICQHTIPCVSHLCVMQGERVAFTGGQDAQSHQVHLSLAIFTQITGDINNKLLVSQLLPVFKVRSDIHLMQVIYFCTCFFSKSLHILTLYWCVWMNRVCVCVCVTRLQQSRSQCHSVRLKFNDSRLAVAHDCLETVRNGIRRTLKH